MAQFKEIEVGQDYEVGEGSYKQFGRVIEKGEFTDTVYHGRSFIGHQVTKKGAKVQFFTYDGKLGDRVDWVRSQAIGDLMVDVVKRKAARAEGVAQAQAQAKKLEALLKKHGLEYASCYYQEHGDRPGFRTNLGYDGVVKLTALLEGLK